MADPLIGVIFDRAAHPGAKTLAELRTNAGKYLCNDSLPLSAALAREWPADAHLLLYILRDEDGGPVTARVNKHSAFTYEFLTAGGRVDVQIVALDYDNPEHGTWAGPEAAAEWINKVFEADVPAPTVLYTTRGGGRLVYVLTESIRGPEAESLVQRLIERWAAAGVPLDRKCADWTRLFRLPRALRADTGASFHTDPAFFEITDGPELEPRSLGALEARQAPAYAEVDDYDGRMPTVEECAELLKRGAKQTDFAREAKRMLRGRESYALAFEEAQFDEKRLAEGWDNAVMFHVGQVVSMVCDIETSTPEGCFALLRGALEQLSAHDVERKDWLAIGWDKLRRVWAQESSKLKAERQERERLAAEGAARRVEIAQAVRAVTPEGMPSEPEDLASWLERRMIASDGRRHYVMKKDGSYNLGAVGDSMLIPMIRELGMDDTIPVKALKGHQLVYCGASEVLSKHAVPVVAVRCSARETIARIEGQEGERVLRVPIHRLNPKLTPAFSTEVDEWLRELFGTHYTIGTEWLAHALDVASPICALNLHGEPGSGKGMLAQGVAECFEGESPNDGRAMDRFNLGLLRSPMIWCDEGIPQIRSLGSTTDQVFRTLVSGGPMQIEGKMRDVITADIFPRIVIASNNKDILRELIGNKDLTDDDVRAIEQRLLTVHVGPEARRLLSAKGNARYTRGWIAGEGPSNYVIANHIFHLFVARKPSGSSSGRFLVEGEMRTELVRDLRLRTDASQAVLRALARMLEQASPRPGLHIVEGRAWVTVSGVTDYLDSQAIGGANRITMPQVGHVLRQFSTAKLPHEEYVSVTRPIGSEKKGRWIELDLTMLLEECLRYGMASDRIEALLRLQSDGPARVAEAKAVVTK